MINFLAICLVLSSLSAPGVWSPTPEKHQKESQDVFAGDGYRAQHNTRVPTSNRHGFISDSDEEKLRSSSNYLQTTKNCAEGAHNDMQGLKEFTCDAHNDMHGLKEFTCNALGKYKHYVEKGKEMALEKVHQANEAEFVKAEDVEEKAKETIEKVKDKVSEKTIDLKDLVKETAEKGIERMKEAKDIGKTIRHDIATNVSETLETTEEEAKARGKETMKTIKLVAERVKVGSQKATNGLIRGGRKLVILMATFMAAPALASAVSLFGVAIAFGMGVWVTFLSSYVLARAIPRHQVALAHSKIYPIYFRAMAVSIVMTFLDHLLRRKTWSSTDTALVLQGYNLLAALLLVFANLYVEPRARKVMFDKEKAEKDEGRGSRGEVEMVDSVLTDKAGRESHDHPYETEDADYSSAVRRGAAPPKATPHVPEGEPTIDELSRRLEKLNFYTSFLNGVTLMALAWHLVFFNQRLSFNI